MTTLERLFEQRNLLTNSLNNLDTLILKEISILASSGYSAKTGNLPSLEEKSVLPNDYPIDGSWRAKLLYILKENQNGLKRREIEKLLKERHIGAYPNPAISAQLNHMAREGKVEIRQSANGNIYLIKALK